MLKSLALDIKMKKLNVITTTFILIIYSSIWIQAFAFDEINLGYFSNVALDGYDPVGYFKESKSLKGKKSISYEWKEATWLFSSDENRQLFIANPEKYAPQYGGYCSNQMSLGNLSEIDTDVWRLIDNRLYFFGHEAGTIRWAEKTESRIQDADGHWDRYLRK